MHMSIIKHIKDRNKLVAKLLTNDNLIVALFRGQIIEYFLLF